MFEPQLPRPPRHVLADDADLGVQPLLQGVWVKPLFEIFNLRLKRSDLLLDRTGIV